MLCIAVAALFGCAAVPRLYPVCFYSEAPSVDTFARIYAPQLQNALNAQLANSSWRQPIVVMHSGRWIIASTTENEHAKLSALWPRLACIGRSDGETDAMMESYCVGYVYDFLVSQNYLAFGEYAVGDTVKMANQSPNPTRLVYCSSALPAD